MFLVVSGFKWSSYNRFKIERVDMNYNNFEKLVQKYIASLKEPK